MDTYTPTARTTVKRKADRGSYDRALVHSILDEAYICHLGFATEDGPVVLPTMHARIDDTLYVHGSVASHMLRTAAGGAPVCATVTLLDGLVLARSAFHHSMNYRSVVVYGEASAVSDEEEKLAAMRALIERVEPGRWDTARQPTKTEIRQTTVLAIPLIEVSAKVRTGGPIDDDEDMDLPVWAGVIPLALAKGPAVQDGS